MKPTTERLMLLDAASLYFRAFYGVPDTVTAPDGTPVNAVRGMLDFIARLVTDRSPTRLVACMDADWRPAFRVDVLPSYKAHRVTGASGEDSPELLTPQVPVIEAVLDALGIARHGAPGFEADDVIGTLVTRATCPVDVVTGDRDLFQLVDDDRSVRVLYTARGVGRHEVVDEAAVTRKYGIPGRAYADFALLRGDPSDGLPGVAGIGDKTAATLITRFGDLPAILAALEDPKSDLAPGPRRRLADARDYLAAAPVVVQVARDIDIPELADALPTQPADPEMLAAIGERFGLGGSLDRVRTALYGTSAGAS